jgi:hypothetical protein
MKVRFWKLLQTVWNIVGIVSVLLAFVALKSDVRLEAKSTAKGVNPNPFGALFILKNEGSFAIYDVRPSCSTSYGTADYNMVIVNARTPDPIHRLPSHSSAVFVCNFDAAASGLASEPYKVNKKEFVATVKVAYRPIFWFGVAPKEYSFWARPTKDGDTDWLPMN